MADTEHEFFASDGDDDGEDEYEIGTPYADPNSISSFEELNTFLNLSGTSNPKTRGFAVQNIICGDVNCNGLALTKDVIESRKIELMAMSELELSVELEKSLAQQERFNYEGPDDESEPESPVGPPPTARGPSSLGATEKIDAAIAAKTAGEIEVLLMALNGSTQILEMMINAYTLKMYGEAQGGGFNKCHMKRREQYKKILTRIGKEDPEFITSLAISPYVVLGFIFTSSCVEFVQSAPRLGKLPENESSLESDSSTSS